MQSKKLMNKFEYKNRQQWEMLCIITFTGITNRLQEDSDLYYVPVKIRGLIPN